MTLNSHTVSFNLSHRRETIVQRNQAKRSPFSLFIFKVYTISPAPSLPSLPPSQDRVTPQSPSLPFPLPPSQDGGTPPSPASPFLPSSQPGQGYPSLNCPPLPSLPASQDRATLNPLPLPFPPFLPARTGVPLPLLRLPLPSLPHSLAPARTGVSPPSTAPHPSPIPDSARMAVQCGRYVSCVHTGGLSRCKCRLWAFGSVQGAKQFYRYMNSVPW